VHDLRPRNDITIKDYSQMPDIAQILREAAKISENGEMSLVDMSNSYHQIRVDPKDEHLNAINTIGGTLNVRVMLQGDCNAPATMTRVMTALLHKYIGKSCYVYLDDIIILSKNKEDHAQHIREIFKTLENNEFHLRMNKCQLYKSKLEILGNTIENGKIYPQIEKISKVTDFEPPEGKNKKKKLQKFLGMVNYLAPHAKNIHIITKPLSELTGNTPWRWTNLEQKAFDNTKIAIERSNPITPLDYGEARRGEWRNVTSGHVKLLSSDQSRS
jgi:hypothetical protein